ncbi:MAG: DNA-processing protein DprA [Candidatus Paceibacterota bacterium]|jgi:DNA processing protein
MLEEFPISKLEKGSFPLELFEIPEPPKELYVRGDLPPPTYIRLAVVGARKFTSYGKEACRKLILGLQGSPVTIVSGLALGIDVIAHEAAIEAKLPTIAIPGSGLGEKVLYPRSNVALAHKILRSGGALLSEMAPEERAQIWSFPRRNRIMAGISKAVIVIEAERKSGTLITARLATEYNRDVLTVPGSIFSANSEGPTLLMRLGATPVATSADILDALGITGKPQVKQKGLFDDLGNNEMIVYKHLSSPLSRDELLAATELSLENLNSAITLLELKGAVKESQGKVFIV